MLKNKLLRLFTFNCIFFLILLNKTPAISADITWDEEIQTNFDDSIEQDGIIADGKTLGVLTEIGAINPSTGITDEEALLAVFGAYLSGGVIGALATGVGLIDSIIKTHPVATISPTFQTTVSSSDPNTEIIGVNFIVQGVFLTQKKEGLIFTDISSASAEGQITFGGKLANIDFTPFNAQGETEQVKGTMFSGTADIEIDPTASALFSFTSTLNALEAGGPYDSLSAAIFTRWEATALTQRKKHACGCFSTDCSNPQVSIPRKSIFASIGKIIESAFIQPAYAFHTCEIPEPSTNLGLLTVGIFGFLGTASKLKRKKNISTSVANELVEEAENNN